MIFSKHVVYAQNDLVKLLIKCLLLIVKPLFMISKFLVHVWRYDIFSTSLVCIKPMNYNIKLK